MICPGHPPWIVLWSNWPKQNSGFRDGIGTLEEVGKRRLEVGYGDGDVNLSVCKSLGLQIKISVDGELEWGIKIRMKS